MDLFVNYDCYCISDEREDALYGSWSQDWDFSVNGVSLTETKHKTEKFATAFDVLKGDTVFVLSIIYNSGDSFGCASGKGEVLWIFKDELLAKEAVLKTKYACGLDVKSKKPQSISFKVESGKTIKIGNPTYDYFDNATSVNLEAFIVK